MSANFGDAGFGRAAEAPEEVVVTRAVACTQGLQPEDLGALVYLLLMPAGEVASAKDLAAGMRELGWRMSIDRFEVIAKRLMASGHLHRESVYHQALKRPQWRYWAYRNPANNPEYVQTGADALSQVTAEVGENPMSEHQAAGEIGDSPVRLVRAGIGFSPTSGNPGRPNRTFAQVRAEIGKSPVPPVTPHTPRRRRIPPPPTPSRAPRDRFRHRGRRPRSSPRTSSVGPRCSCSR